MMVLNLNTLGHYACFAYNKDGQLLRGYSIEGMTEMRDTLPYAPAYGMGISLYKDMEIQLSGIYNWIHSKGWARLPVTFRVIDMNTGFFVEGNDLGLFTRDLGGRFPGPVAVKLESMNMAMLDTHSLETIFNSDWKLKCLI